MPFFSSLFIELCWQSLETLPEIQIEIKLIPLCNSLVSTLCIHLLDFCTLCKSMLLEGFL